MIDLPHDLQSDDYGSGPLDHERLEIQDNRMGIEFAALMAEEANLPTEAFDRCRKYNAAATSKGMDHIDTYSKQLARLGEDHQVLDATDMKAVWNKLLPTRVVHPWRRDDPAGSIHSGSRNSYTQQSCSTA